MTPRTLISLLSAIAYFSWIEKCSLESEIYALIFVTGHKLWCFWSAGCGFKCPWAGSLSCRYLPVVSSRFTLLESLVAPITAHLSSAAAFSSVVSQPDQSWIIIIIIILIIKTCNLHISTLLGVQGADGCCPASASLVGPPNDGIRLASHLHRLLPYCLRRTTWPNETLYHNCFNL